MLNSKSKFIKLKIKFRNKKQGCSLKNLSIQNYASSKCVVVAATSTEFHPAKADEFRALLSIT